VGDGVELEGGNIGDDGAVGLAGAPIGNPGVGVDLREAGTHGGGPGDGGFGCEEDEVAIGTDEKGVGSGGCGGGRDQVDDGGAAVGGGIDGDEGGLEGVGSEVELAVDGDDVTDVEGWPFGGVGVGRVGVPGLGLGGGSDEHLDAVDVEVLGRSQTGDIAGKRGPIEGVELWNGRGRD
jgi:hypothetical protein